jgi:hypothetical protein
MAAITRDGGSGPDDFAAFVGETGKVAVYQGDDPGDANNWSLVGVYKIGRPLSRSAYVQFGQQLVVLCEDDFYFLPEDLAGKRKSTIASEHRHVDTAAFETTNAIHDESEGLLVFSEGSVLSTKHNFAYSTLTMSSAPPDQVRRSRDFLGVATGQRRRPMVARYKGKSYCMAPLSAASSASLMQVQELLPSTATNTSIKARINTAPLPTKGGTTVYLVNPLLAAAPKSTTSTDDASAFLTYRTALTYGNHHRRYWTASSELFVTASASNDSYGLWTPAYGMGDKPQVHIQVLAGSTDKQDMIFYGIDLIASDTGGI